MSQSCSLSKAFIAGANTEIPNFNGVIMCKMILCLLSLMSAINSSTNQDFSKNKAAKSFESLCASLPKIVKLSKLPNVKSSDNTKSALIYSKVRVARIIEPNKAKITLAIYMRDADENQPDGLITVYLSYFEGRWSTTSNDCSEFYRRSKESDAVRVFMLLIDSFEE